MRSSYIKNYKVRSIYEITNNLKVVFSQMPHGRIGLGILGSVLFEMSRSNRNISRHLDSVGRIME